MNRVVRRYVCISGLRDINRERHNDSRKNARTYGMQHKLVSLTDGADRRSPVVLGMIAAFFNIRRIYMSLRHKQMETPRKTWGGTEMGCAES